MMRGGRGKGREVQCWEVSMRKGRVERAPERWEGYMMRTED